MVGARAHLSARPRQPLAGMGVVVQDRSSRRFPACSSRSHPTRRRHADRVLQRRRRGAGLRPHQPGARDRQRRTLEWSQQAAPGVGIATPLLPDDADREAWRAERSTSSGASARRRTSNGRSMRDGPVWIVQARPITRAPTTGVPPRRPSSGRTPTSTRTFPSRSRRCSTRSRARATTTTSATSDGVRPVARRLAAMDDPLRQIIGVHGARMYYNLTSIHGCCARRRSASSSRHGSTSSSAPRIPTRRRRRRSSRPDSTAGARRSGARARTHRARARRGSTCSSRAASSASSGRVTEFAARTQPMGSSAMPRRTARRSARLPGHSPPSLDRRVARRRRLDGLLRRAQSGCSARRFRPTSRPRCTTACSRRCRVCRAACRR